MNTSARPFSPRSALRRRVVGSVAVGTLLAAGGFGGGFPAFAESGTMHVRAAAGSNGHDPKPPCTFYVEFSNFAARQTLTLDIYKVVGHETVAQFVESTVIMDAAGSRSLKFSLQAATAATMTGIQVDYGPHKQKNISTSVCALEPVTPVSTGDVIPDLVVIPVVTGGTETDTDGDSQTDATDLDDDGDTLPDASDPDDDGDGVPDGQDPDAGGIDPLPETGGDTTTIGSDSTTGGGTTGADTTTGGNIGGTTSGGASDTTTGGTSDTTTGGASDTTTGSTTSGGNTGGTDVGGTSGTSGTTVDTTGGTDLVTTTGATGSTTSGTTGGPNASDSDTTSGPATGGAGNGGADVLGDSTSIDDGGELLTAAASDEGGEPLTAAANRGGALTSGAAGATLTTAGSDLGSSTVAAAHVGTPSPASVPITDDAPMNDRVERAGETITLPRTGPTAKAGATGAATILALLGLAAARLRRRVESTS